MQEIGIRYKGKMCPFVFDNPRLRETLTFPDGKTVLWVEKPEFDWIVSNNPRMFDIIGERKKKKVIGEIVKTKEPELEVAGDGEEGTSFIIKKEPASQIPETPKPKKRGMPKGGWPKSNQKKETTDGDKK